MDPSCNIATELPETKHTPYGWLFYLSELKSLPGIWRLAGRWLSWRTYWCHGYSGYSHPLSIRAQLQKYDDDFRFEYTAHLIVLAMKELMRRTKTESLELYIPHYSQKSIEFGLPQGRGEAELMNLILKDAEARGYHIEHGIDKITISK